MAGLLVIAAALVGPIDDIADERFSVHMVQHVLLTMVAAPLLALGAPMTVLLLCLSRNARRRVTGSVLRSRAMHVLLSPASVFCLFIGVLWGSHYPAVYDAAASNQALHDLEHLCYLVTAVLFWSVVFGFEFGPARPAHPGRLLLLFCMMAGTSVLGLVLTSTPRPLYPHYVQASAAAGIAPLGDQHLGGVIMWLVGMVIVAVAAIPVLLSWLAEDERRTVHSEERAAARAPTVSG
jgi:cytochrome c oxidase assembly factor CtaG